MASFLDQLRAQLEAAGVPAGIASEPALAGMVLGQAPAGLRDAAPRTSYVGGLKQGLAQGGVMGGLYSALGVNPSNEWYPGVMRATQDVGRSLQGALAGDPTFTTRAAQDDRALAQGDMGLSLRGAEYDLSARQYENEQAMASELSQLDPSAPDFRLKASSVYLKYGHADKALELLKAPDSEPLEKTIGPDGQPIYTPRSKAIGMQAYERPQQVPFQISVGEQLKPTLDLRKQYMAETADYHAALSAADYAIAAVDQALRENNPQAAQEAVVRLAKLVDPTTGVREAEVLRAFNAAGIMQRLQNQFGMAAGGIPDRKTMDQIRDVASRIRRDVAPLLKKRESTFRDIASSYEVNPDQVVGGATFEELAPERAPVPAVPPGFTAVGTTSDGKTIYRAPDGKEVVWQD
jgi:hypothetical protein